QVSAGETALEKAHGARPSGLRAVSRPADGYGPNASAALVRDLLGAAVAAADHLLVLHFLVRDDVEGIALDAFLLQLRVDLALEVLAGLAHRRRGRGRGRLRLRVVRRRLALRERERRDQRERCEHR